jgi:hypothetical protein
MPRPESRAALVTVVAALGSWLTSWAIAAAAGLRSDVIVLGTVLAVTASRVVDRPPVRRGELVARFVAVPVVALGASEVGLLLDRHHVWGGVVFCAVLALTIWVRRLGPAWTAIGTLASLPFVALLIAPVVPAPGHEHSPWPAVVALVAVGWVALAQAVSRRTGFLGPASPAPSAPSARTRRGSGVRASTRMAVQMGLALVIAYALGRWWLPDHWPWLLLSAYVTGAGNRGRGDVVHKGVNRLAGALVGTAVATVVASWFGTGDRGALVLLFVVLAVSVWARGFGYAYWAAGVTAMTALLQGYYGQHGLGLLGERLAGVTVGAVVAVVVAWTVLPVRSRDAFRARWADALARTGELLTALRTDPAAVDPARDRLAHAVGQLEQLEPTYRLHRRVLHRRSVPHPADLVAVVRELRLALDDVARMPHEARERAARLLGAWARQVGEVRRRMRPDAEPTAPEKPPVDPPSVGVAALDRTTAAVSALDATFSRDLWRSLGGR